MDWTDIARLLHPALAVTTVFPLIGIACYFAWQTRQRRLQLVGGEKSKISATSGNEHLAIGRMLATLVVILALVGITRPLASKILENNLWSTSPLYVLGIGAILVATATALVLLYRAKKRPWPAVFAAATALGILVLSFQDGIFRRDDEWYVSHFYFGITVTLLMIFSLAIVQNIYQDKSGRWRKLHVFVNSLAALLFIGQGLTGARDLLEIPLHWQEPYVYKCDFAQKTCAAQAPSTDTDQANAVKTEP